MSEIETQEPTPILPKGQAPITETPKEEPIDPNLLDQLAALKSIVKLDVLLQKGSFPGEAAGDILICQEFLKNLHKPILVECQSHKDFARATGSVTPVDTAALTKAEEKRNRKMLREQAKAKKKAN